MLNDKHLININSASVKLMDWHQTLHYISSPPTAKTIRSTLIRHWSDIFVSDRCLIDGGLSFIPWLDSSRPWYGPQLASDLAFKSFRITHLPQSSHMVSNIISAVDIANCRYERSALWPLTPLRRSGGPYHVRTQFYYSIWWQAFIWTNVWWCIYV